MPNAIDDERQTGHPLREIEDVLAKGQPTFVDELLTKILKTGSGCRKPLVIGGVTKIVRETYAPAAQLLCKSFGERGLSTANRASKKDNLQAHAKSNSWAGAGCFSMTQPLRSFLGISNGVTVRTSLINISVAKDAARR